MLILLALVPCFAAGGNFFVHAQKSPLFLKGTYSPQERTTRALKPVEEISVAAVSPKTFKCGKDIFVRIRCSHGHGNTTLRKAVVRGRRRWCLHRQNLS
mmetsp:Transcript_143/g.278  ORF Transcript_143/g.278 Transcript_143/m.278 type:complete len:99 (-) Transcript_143:237-533(-)